MIKHLPVRLKSNSAPVIAAIVVVIVFAVAFSLIFAESALIPPTHKANSNPTWHIATVDDGGAYTSIALDSAGKPIISYSSDTDLGYASWNGRTWNIQTVDAVSEPAGIDHYSAWVGEYASLALDK